MVQNSDAAPSGSVRQNVLVVDLLGDMNRSGIRELRLKALVALAESLGVPGPTVRVTLGRLRARGWFEVRREGRESVYRLSATGLRVLNEGARRIFHPRNQAWHGEWSMVVYTVPDRERSTRDELRRQLAWLGYAPLATATWICPHPRGEEVVEAAALLPAATVTLLSSRTSGLAEDRMLALRCWEVEALNEDYRIFLRDLRERLPRYRGGEVSGAAALVERIGLVNAYRRIVRRDPRFPIELQPAGWLGDEAHRLFDEAHDLLVRDARSHFDAMITANK